MKRLLPKKHKLQSHYVGPFRIMERNGQSVKIKNLGSSKVSEVHLSHVLLIKENEVESVSNGAVKPQIFPAEEYDIEDSAAESSG